MGGQNSKLTPEAEAMPARIRTLLQRKYEEIRNRIRTTKIKDDATLSKKQLLKPEHQEEGVVNSVSQSLHSSPENSSESPKVQPTPEKKSSKVAPVLLDHNEIEGKKSEEVEENKEDQKLENSVEEHKEKQRAKVAKVVPVYIGGVFALEQATEVEEVEENEDHEEGMRSNNYQMFMCPASPSFRVYCQEALEIEKEFEKETDKDESKHDSTCSTDEEINHKKTPSADSSVDSIADNNEGQDTKTKKKGRRRMRNPFNMGGGPNCSVKNLLNVKGCYNTGCSGHDRATLLAEKSAAT